MTRAYIDAQLAGGVKDSTFAVSDESDVTKLLKFQLSGLTTGTTRTLTVPDADDTIGVLGTAQTVTGAKTFGSAGAVGKLKIAGTTSGTIILDAAAVAGTNTLTLPAATDTLVGKDTTDTLTNKTLTAPALTTPSLGVATATTVNKVTITAPATGSTLTIPDGVVFTGPPASGTAATLAGSETLSGKTLTAPAGTGFLISKTILFTENATSVTHTGTIALPANSVLHDIIVTSTALWTDSTASLVVGDADSANGWFTATDLAATDLLVGESLRASDATTGWGGKNGTYLVAATGVFGQTGVTKTASFTTAGFSVIGVVSVTTPSGTAGRTYMTVLYSVPVVTAATVA